MNTQELRKRCDVSVSLLPQAPYREMLTKLHADLLDTIDRLTEELSHAELAATAEAQESDRRKAALVAVTAERDALAKDAARIDWLQRNLFAHQWNGVIDSGSRTNWSIWSEFHHVTAGMVGDTFRAAIDAAMKEQL